MIKFNFFIQVPPEDITISRKVINVIVDTIPETVECNAKARPKANFRWFREGAGDTIMEGHVFDLKMPVPRRSNGTYYCEASNRHGSLNISMVMNVQCTFHCILRLSLDFQMNNQKKKKTSNFYICATYEKGRVRKYLILFSHLFKLNFSKRLLPLNAKLRVFTFFSEFHY